VPEQLSRPYRWTSIGGHLALDLCNTVSWRIDPARRIDRLSTADDLVDWFGTLTDLPPSDRERLTRHAAEHRGAAEKALQEIKELRAATFQLMDAHLQPSSTTTGARTRDAETIAAAWQRALAVASTPEQLPWRWTIELSEPGDVMHALALAVADLVHGQDLTRLRRCDGDGCGWLFLDTTRNHSRRWCDPLDCGNRARVRAYASRHRS
jgi:predicted RNA-binding Zn ribbon-like protein